MLDSDRRKYRRYMLAGETVVVTMPNLVISDAMIDISEGGLAFSYHGWTGLTGTLVDVDVLRNDICLESLPCRVVSDIPLQKQNRAARRCGLEFTGLTVEHRALLAELFARNEGAEATV